LQFKSEKDSMRIRSVPVQPHCFLYGGFDIQMGRTNEVLTSVGVDARPLDFWDRKEDFEILHLWGLELQHQKLIHIAKSYGKKIVMTPLLPYVSDLTYMRHWMAALRGRKKIELDIVRSLDLMLVVNQLQAESAEKLFRLPSKKIEIIPTILDPLFFKKTITPQTLVDEENYIVCPGNILPRKNQVRLAHAAIEVGHPIVFIGDLMGGEDKYGREFYNLMGTSLKLKWYRSLDWEALYRVIASASIVALPSFNECQPAAGLEAAALGKPLLLGDRPYAYQEFFKGAMTVNPASIDSIAKGLMRITQSPSVYTPKRSLVEACNPNRVSLNLKKIFETLVGK
jgi:glycosyltransferase involved in cell wall biosynthesis